MSDNKQKTIYRYEIQYSNAEGDETNVNLLEYKVVRETDYTYFIDPNPFSRIFDERFIHKLKRVKKDAYNTFAYDTKEKALNHFNRRTFRRIQWFEYWQKECEKALEIAKGIKL